MVLALDARLVASRLDGTGGAPLSDETERVGRTQPDADLNCIRVGVKSDSALANATFRANA